MGRALAWVVAIVGAGAAVTLTLRLWRLRKTAEGRWRPQDYLTALGLAVAVLGIVLPPLMVQHGDDEPDEVTRYRREVRAACASLQPTSDPVFEAMNPDGSVDRVRLEHGFWNQLTAAQGVLGALWERTPPLELDEPAADARGAADELLADTANELDQMATELPTTIPLAELAAYLGAMDAELLPAAGRFEAAMSHLADQDCRAPPVDRSSSA